jgi:hypothetical protein
MMKKAIKAAGVNRDVDHAGGEYASKAHKFGRILVGFT